MRGVAPADGGRRCIRIWHCSVSSGVLHSHRAVPRRSQDLPPAGERFMPAGLAAATVRLPGNQGFRR